MPLKSVTLEKLDKMQKEVKHNILNISIFALMYLEHHKENV